VTQGIIEVDPLTMTTDTIKLNLGIPYLAMDVLMLGTGRDKDNKVFASGQAIREACLSVLRPTVHGSETSRTQKRNRGFTLIGTA